MRPFRIETADNVHIQMYEYSQEGEPILFLHYSRGTASVWNHMITAFTEKYRVLTMDLRGHGRSSQPESGYDIATLAEDIRIVLDACEIDRVHLVGSSLGAFVGTCFASRYPERVITLVNSEGALLNHAGEGGRYQESKQELIERYFSREESSFPSPADFFSHMQETWLPWNEARAKSLEGYEPRALPDGGYGYITKLSTSAQVFAAIYDTRLQDWYETITCPVLFLPAHQEGDLDLKLAFLKEVEPLLPVSKTVVIPETSHAMMFDHAEEFSQEILQFYAEHSHQ
ncbi:alpha/beta fold hydrolase [Brevibacillus dissolubilis]|uniref:alpha/beta fold hydrolase n=1 Tax=Brevibacillus dissolubilis TaxID=1844116 RepID=UPI001115E760|nr:alpha/beta hydrolase [Brevibacillus dissolubilis]